MNFIIWIIFGGIAGWIASIIMKTDAQQGKIMNVVLGIIGAVVGGWIFSIFGAQGVTGFNLYSFIVAIIGAIIVIGVWGFIAGRKTKSV
jgi:uncharacterized membrane protein YeaQ/YmgE (transglycosylase-associated protein family)